jgi:hypothetical protein
MTTLPEGPQSATEQPDDDLREQRQMAISYVSEAFGEGRLDGLDDEALAQAAIFMALKTLVDIYGEEATSAFAEALPRKITAGEFSIATRH